MKQKQRFSSIPFRPSGMHMCSYAFSEDELSTHINVDIGSARAPIFHRCSILDACIKVGDKFYYANANYYAAHPQFSEKGRESFTHPYKRATARFTCHIAPVKKTLQCVYFRVFSGREDEVWRPQVCFYSQS
ncbi:hypothetical protein NECAME_13878 [Necator americanus]|uniref:Uncharacterized protein n=1 Tax=Necator americanus TaxID=51031 RepID=W2SS13_NECAM|nr:hypothetical protein NECAME_13878 [Necator americanus]ETN72410.1 hypothetical protein NECAME_13878 [Necator americanus]